MTNENLYEQVKAQICEDIFRGKYQDGDRLPPERELLESLGVSRVTIRKSLELLEQEHLLLREVGRGTKVTLPNYGNPSALDMIVLIAPAKNPFFSEFIRRFQIYAEKKDSLILYMEKPKEESLENCLYRLYKRGLRNVVIWPEDLTVDPEYLKRLRAIGMNFVFFDSNQGLPYADCVALDGAKAIERLMEELRKKTDRIGYITWNLKHHYSLAVREQAYRKCAGEREHIIHLPWKKTELMYAALKAEIKKFQELGIEALLCSDLQCEELLAKLVIEEKLTFSLSGIDAIDSIGREFLMYQQDLPAMVERIYACLEKQCQMGANWEAKLYLQEGSLKVSK